MGKHQQELALFALPSYLQDEKEPNILENHEDELPDPSKLQITDASPDRAIIRCELCNRIFAGDDEEENHRAHLITHHSMIACSSEDCKLVFDSWLDMITHKGTTHPREHEHLHDVDKNKSKLLFCHECGHEWVYHASESTSQVCPECNSEFNEVVSVTLDHL